MADIKIDEEMLLRAGLGSATRSRHSFGAF